MSGELDCRTLPFASLRVAGRTNASAPTQPGYTKIGRGAKSPFAPQLALNSIFKLRVH